MASTPQCDAVEGVVGDAVDGVVGGDRVVAVPADWDDWDHSSLPIISDDPEAHVWLASLGSGPWADEASDPACLLAHDPEDLSADDAVDYLVELQRAQARLAALKARALVVVAGRTRQDRQVLVDALAAEGGSRGGADRTLTISDEVREELAAALHRSPTAMHEHLVTARMLAGPLPATMAALERGRITLLHARAISDEVRRLSTSEGDAASFARDCALVEARVLPRAHELTVGATRRLARTAVLRVDADGQGRRRLAARRGIDVHLYAEDDGLAVLLARLPLAEATRVHAAIDAAARDVGDLEVSDGSSTTLGQRRARALVDAVCGRADAAQAPDLPASPTSSRGAVEVSIVVDAAALLGVADTPATITGALGGPQTLSVQAVRDLLADPAVPASLRRLLVEPTTGHLLDRGRTAYAVTPDLRAFLVARDVTCRHPGCTRPAARCQIDHAREWSDGGTTDPGNTGALCIRHHQLKTHGGWRIIDSRPDGSCTWRSPAGRTYAVGPPPLVPD